LSPMPLRLCSVGFKSATGISHSVDVEAETLYEAAALGLARLKKRWVDRRPRSGHSARDPSPWARQPSCTVRSAGRALDQQRECESDRDSEEGEVATTTQVLRITS